MACCRFRRTSSSVTSASVSFSPIVGRRRQTFVLIEAENVVPKAWHRAPRRRHTTRRSHKSADKARAVESEIVVNAKGSDSGFLHSTGR